MMRGTPDTSISYAAGDESEFDESEFKEFRGKTLPEVTAVHSCGSARDREAARATLSLGRACPALNPSHSEVRRRNPGRRLWRFLADCAWALLHDDLVDRIDQIPEYRNARTQALQYAMLRNINR